MSAKFIKVYFSFWLGLWAESYNIHLVRSYCITYFKLLKVPKAPPPKKKKKYKYTPFL